MREPYLAVVDLGLGNLNSVRWALERAGARVAVTRDPAVIRQADGVVLPGVGHYRAGAERLAADGLDRVLRERAARVPLLGICLGMQLLFERSEEGGRGLGLFPGVVTRLSVDDLPLPHVGWNGVEVRAAAGIVGAVGGGEAYFCHTYAVRPSDALLAAAVTDYGEPFVSAVQRGWVTGVQFHPEKSGAYGARFLQAFVDGVARCSS
jgi:glutamine amidotransferase